MADPNEADKPDQLAGDVEYGDEPFDQEPMEVEPPRRAASVQFAVDAEVGSQAALREAMDPANQSLADALRLSFQVLQGVIVVLIVLFLVSGFRTVEDRQSGVMLQWGRIVAVDGQEFLDPGLHHNFLPYPAGEFVTFDVQNRSVDVSRTFWPLIAPGQGLQQAIDRASVNGALRPGRDGYVLTTDGGMAHLRLSGEYEIADPVQFVKWLQLDDADRVVRLALQRAVVHITAGLELQEVVDLSDSTRQRIQQSAQGVLDSMGCGIDLVEVKVSDTKPPFAIVKVYGELQNAREQAREQIERARKDAEQTLIATSSNYRVLAGMIQRYEQALELGDEDSAAAELLLTEIGAALESDNTSGEVAQLIYHARAYESEIESTLGNEARLFASVLPLYRENPESVIGPRWQEAYASVLSQADAEIFYVPGGLRALRLTITGSEEIQQRRQQNQFERLERKATEDVMRGRLPFVDRPQDYDLDKARPLLEVAPEGTIRSRGTGP